MAADTHDAATIEQRMVEQVDQLSETLIERNAEINRLRAALREITKTPSRDWHLNAKIAREALDA